MAFDNPTAVSVTTTATIIAQDDGDGCIATIKNVGSQDVFLGGAGVTTANGVALGVGAALSLDIEQGGKLYGIVAATTCEVRVMRHRV